ncbi:MAG: RNA polymerase-binding protein DksA [Gammaproteobacteria bacterium]|nr:RNA polymerase-binding protein DksA [Gammaproteobacteria bacterium]MYF01670.1 RNA polymerase-binding protein DksA [Gammaproteobacteria bacterium]MYI78108.1 RNA polymerase-binding protein DksA [Gammaproteobacteria bacterium]
MTTDDYVIGFQGIYYKPYQLTNSDLFMSGAQQDHFMDILTRAKEKLLAEEADRASQLQENDASNLPDPLDQGTNEGVFHNQLRTRDRESQLVRKINRAIDCLKTGSYGYCEACGCEIPIRRLEARPIVTKCIDCKERDELRERQLGQ